MPGFRRQASVRAKHVKTSDGITQGGAQENIRWKMGLQCYAGESYDSGNSVGDPRDPPVISISNGENSGHGERGCGVPGRKTVFEDSIVGAKKSIVEGTLWSNLGRPQSPGHGI